MNPTGSGLVTGVEYSDFKALVMPSSKCDLDLESCTQLHCNQGPPHVMFSPLDFSGQGRVFNAVEHCSENTRPCPELEESRDSQSVVQVLKGGLRSIAKSGSDFSFISHFNFMYVIYAKVRDFFRKSANKKGPLF